MRFLIPLILGACCAQAQEGWILAEVTAYAGNCPLCETTGVTADGTRTSTRPYGIAASPDIGLGAKIFIPALAGYLDQSRPSGVDRWFVADDRGGALRSEWKRSGITRLDLRYRTHSSAKEFGRKYLLVYVSLPAKANKQ